MAKRTLSLAAIAPLALFAVLGIAFGLAFMRDDVEALPSVYINKPAPALNVEALPGYAVYGPEDLATDGLKLVNFWASWCPPCRAEHPTLMRLADEGWTIIGINKSDKEANAIGFLRELGNPYKTIGADPEGRASLEWGVYGLPETFIIDGTGNIRLRYPGPVTGRIWTERFLPVIEAIRAEASPPE